MEVILYALGKIIAYCVLCYLGVRLFKPTAGHPVAICIALGLLRFGLGLLFALPIYIVSNQVYGQVSAAQAGEALTYIAVYVPVRWVEWSIMALLVVAGSRSPAGFLLGADGRDRLWRAVGIVTSCAADIPLMLWVGGLPIGRFFC